MKTYAFALPEAEAECLDANIGLLMYAFPDLTEHDALIALVRRGSEDVQHRIEQMMARTPA
jgi:hypothetical protein